jgi:hypothetical protein
MQMLHDCLFSFALQLCCTCATVVAQKQAGKAQDTPTLKQCQATLSKRKKKSEEK